jgi:hypothetical protein
VKADIYKYSSPTYLSTANLNVNVHIEHDEDALDGSGVLALAFRDRHMEIPYSAHNIAHSHLIDSSKLYLLVRGNVPEGYDLRIVNVSVCVGLTGPLEEYDHHRPNTTGCNTPGVGAVFYTVWSHGHPSDNNPLFDAFYLTEFGLSSTEDGIGMTVRVLSPYGNQYLIVYWEIVVWNHHPILGPNAPTTQPPIMLAKRSMVALEQQHPKKQMVTFGKSKVLMSRPEHDDDEDHDHDDDSYDTCHGEDGCYIDIHPTCPEGHRYSPEHGRCMHHDRIHAHDWLSHNFWILLLCTLVFIIFVVGVCACLCGTSSKLSMARDYYQRSHHDKQLHRHHHKKSIVYQTVDAPAAVSNNKSADTAGDYNLAIESQATLASLSFIGARLDRTPLITSDANKETVVKNSDSD